MIIYREDVLRDVDAAIDNVDHVPQWFIDIIDEAIKNVPAHTARCIIVGQNMTQHYECDQCGTTIDGYDDYCKGCGAMIVGGDF